MTALLVPLWSLFFAYAYCGYYPTASPVVSRAAVALGTVVGTRFWFERTREGDKRSYVLYNVSFSNITRGSHLFGFGGCHC